MILINNFAVEFGAGKPRASGDDPAMADFSDLIAL